MSTENNKAMFDFFGKKSAACDRGTGPSVMRSASSAIQGSPCHPEPKAKDLLSKQSAPAEGRATRRCATYRAENGTQKGVAQKAA